MKKIFNFLIILFSLTFIFDISCNNPTSPPKPKPENPKAIKLKLLDVSCTEAFIKVTASDTVLPVNINLTKDDSSLFNFILTQNDTVVIDTTLLPNKTYIYQTTAEIKGKTEKSDTIQVESLDTTSDNFNWQIYAFGNPNYGSSTLFDVSVVNENNIWAVGEIHNDTTGLLYNAAHWGGSSWELKRISVQYHGNLITPPLYGVYAFSATDIWFSSGVPIYGDGTNWTQYHLFDMGILGQDDGYLTKIWGTSSSNIYYVGTLGTIVHYQNGTWSKIESGTTTNINDIWGYYNTSSNRGSVLCVASNIFHQGEYRLLAVSGSVAHDTLNWSYTDWLKGVWFKNQYSPVYICGSGVKMYKNNNWSLINLPNYFTEAIRGENTNNIYVVGDFGVVAHFNGMRWKTIDELFGIGKFLGLSVKDNTVAICGYSASGGIVGSSIVIIGKK